MKHLTLSGILITIMLLSCGKKEVCPDDFIVYGSVSPYREYYHTGDTIHFEVKQDIHAVKARNTGKYYDLDSMIFLSGMNIVLLDTNIDEAQIRLQDYFDIIYDSTFKMSIWQHNDSSSSLDMISIILNDSIYAAVDIIPKKEGVYLSNFGVYKMPMVHCGLSYFLFPHCDYNDFSLTTRLNPGKDNNISLLYDSPEEHYNQWVTSKAGERFYDGGSFAFRVIDKVSY